MHAVELVYQAAGQPPQPGALTTAEWEALKRTKAKPGTPPTGSCYLTGIALNGRGIPCASRLKDATWTGHGAAVARDSEWLSEAAVFCLGEKATHPTEPKPFKMRTKSHLVEDDEWAVLGMGDKEPMFTALLGAYPHDAPWLLAICTAPLSASHVLHQTPVNQPGAVRWVVSLGGSLVDGSAAELEPLLTAVNAGYVAGHSKTAIRSGEYNTKWITAQGEAAWAEMEAYLRPFRGRPIFELALFLAQKGD